MDGLENLKRNFKKFDGTDFVLWKDKVQAALKASKCVKVIKTEFKIKIEGEDEIKAEKEKKNVEMIRQNISGCQQSQIIF